jgi:hypothetical protein
MTNGREGDETSRRDGDLVVATAAAAAAAAVDAGRPRWPSDVQTRSCSRPILSQTTLRELSTTPAAPMRSSWRPRRFAGGGRSYRSLRRSQQQPRQWRRSRLACRWAYAMYQRVSAGKARLWPPVGGFSPGLADFNVVQRLGSGADPRYPQPRWHPSHRVARDDPAEMGLSVAASASVDVLCNSARQWVDRPVSLVGSGAGKSRSKPISAW